MRRDAAAVLCLALAAFFIRTWPAWDTVFSPAGTRFLETDAWYHVRLVENQVRNYPWRITRDPYAAPDGQFIPIAPLFDTLTATVIVVLHGRDATTAEVERVAALMPPLFGALTVAAVWALARALFDRRAALVAAALVAVLPGHLMDRTMLGFVDHHALEALLAVSVLHALVRGLSASSPASTANAGVLLGLYLLTWSSGAFLVAVVALWVIAHALLARDVAAAVRPARVAMVAAAVALTIVVLLQDPAMHRYGSQLLALAGLTLVSLIPAALASARSAIAFRMRAIAALLGAALVGGAVATWMVPELLQQVTVDVRRLTPDASRMGVLEARPLFRYSGEWDWRQPWLFFRTGFFIGAVALVPFALRVWRRRAAGDLLLLLFASATFAATLGQNRFGYYLVTACAVLGGWLAAEILDWGGVPHAGNPDAVGRTRLPLAREAAVVLVAAGMFAPNIAPRVLLAERTASYPDFWRDTMRWLREHTPAPFAAGDAYYYARYDDAGVRAAEYTVMSWWDQGYWIIQQARRVPVANPTQGAAPVAGRFYSATSEDAALEILRQARSRYVVSDYELPFRRLADGAIMGRFQTIVDWTGAAHAPFYEIAYRREGGAWTPVWVFHEPYYRSMAFRLSVLGGGAAPPAAATVAILATRVDANGLRFRELVAEQTYATFAAAQEAAAASGGTALVIGLDPWQSPFPVNALRSLHQVHAATTADQTPGQTPWVRVFEVR